MYCKKCRKETNPESRFCPDCGERLEKSPINNEDAGDARRSLKGHVLGFDASIGTGAISGEDGNRYRFDRQQWREQVQPYPGKAVNFVAEGEVARDVYIEWNRPPSSGPGPSGPQTTRPTPPPFTKSPRYDYGGQKSKVAAGLFAIFLGTLGVHKFYLGYPLSGIIMLVVSIVGIFLLVIPTLVVAIVALIEGIIYLTKSDEEFDNDYVEGERSWF